MAFIKTILLAGSIACLVACSSSSKEVYNLDKAAVALAGGSEYKTAGTDESAAEAGAHANQKTETKLMEQKLIKNGSIVFETSSTKETKAFLQKAISIYKGYISNEQIEDYRTNPTEILTVRVPNPDFDNLIDAIGSEVGEFDSKQITIEDVTAEFVDVEARLKNKKQLEGKYQELLARASSMEDILKIEKEISLIREDIESTEGRLRYLNNQVGFSTLHITYYEKKATAGFHFGDKMGNAVADGGMGFLWFLIGITHLWPVWLMAAVTWYGIYKFVKRRKNRKLNQKTIQQN